MQSRANFCAKSDHALSEISVLTGIDLIILFSFFGRPEDESIRSVE